MVEVAAMVSSAARVESTMLVESAALVFPGQKLSQEEGIWIKEHIILFLPNRSARTYSDVGCLTLPGCLFFASAGAWLVVLFCVPFPPPCV
jgi:hypothetical protein